MGSEVSKLYNLYEIFNDFNRLRIIVAMYNGEYTSDDLSNVIGMNSISVIHQLEFLVSKKVISKIELDNTIKYKISDKRFDRIISQIINYSK